MAGQPNNSWNTSDGDVDSASKLYQFVVYTVIIVSLIVVGVIGNSLAFVVFWKDSTKTSASFLFQSLALVDTAFLLTALVYFPLPALVNYTDGLDDYWDILYPYVMVYIRPLLEVSRTASVWVVVLFAVNRYIAVCFPLKSLRWCSISKVKKQLAIVLLFSVLVIIPVFAEGYIEYKTDDNGTTYMKRKFAEETLYHILYYVVFYQTAILALPLAILAVLNIRLIKALKKSRRNRMEMLSRRQKHDNNSTFLLIIIVVVFIVCQLPAFINDMLSEVKDYSDRYLLYIQPIVAALVVLNSTFNFVIYAVFNKRFRQVLAQTVCGSRGLDVDGRRERENVPR